MTLFAAIHSTQASTPQLYAARRCLEQEGRHEEHNAIAAFLDQYQPRTIIRGLTVQEPECGCSAQLA